MVKCDISIRLIPCCYLQNAKQLRVFFEVRCVRCRGRLVALTQELRSSQGRTGSPHSGDERRQGVVDPRASLRVRDVLLPNWIADIFF